MTATSTDLTRFACYITGGENDEATHAWIDTTPQELKAELASLKAKFDKAVQGKRNKKTYDKKGYLSANHVGGYSLTLQIGNSSLPELDFYTNRNPYDQFVAVTPTPDEYAEFPHDPDGDDLPAGINPDQWTDANLDGEYAIRLTDKGVYFVVSASYGSDDDAELLDETPLLPYDFIP